MQDHSDRLRKDKRGVIDLPIKLMVIMVILVAAIPILSDAVDTAEKDIAAAEVEHEAGKLMDGIASVHYSGIGSSVTVDIRLPAGSEISIGGTGSNAYCLRMLYNGEESSRLYFEKPSVKVCEETFISGSCTLMLTSQYSSGTPIVKVSFV